MTRRVDEIKCTDDTCHIGELLTNIYTLSHTLYNELHVINQYIYTITHTI